MLLFLVHGGRALCSVGAMPAIWCSGLHSELSHGVIGVTCTRLSGLDVERSDHAVDASLVQPSHCSSHGFTWWLCWLLSWWLGLRVSRCFTGFAALPGSLQPTVPSDQQLQSQEGS